MVPTNCLDVSQNGCPALYYISMKNFQTLRCTCVESQFIVSIWELLYPLYVVSKERPTKAEVICKIK